MEQVVLHLPEDQAELFKKFVEISNTLEILIDAGVFRIQYGSTTLNFAEGKLMNIERKDIIYKRNVPKQGERQSGSGSD